VARQAPQKCRPGENPYQKQHPEEPERHGGVVFGVAQVKIAQEMLVDKIEPEKGLVGKAGGQMPGGCNDQENHKPREDLQAFQDLPATAQQEVAENNAADKDNADQSFSENGQRHCRIDAQAA